MTDIWRGRLVRLRAVEPEDWETHAAWNQDSAMSRQLDQVWFPTSSARARDWADEASRRSVEDDGFDFEIEALSDGALVGSLGVHHCDRRVGSFFYGVATREGTLRRMAFTGGQRHDIVAFGLTADEFAVRYPELAAPW